MKKLRFLPSTLAIALLSVALSTTSCQQAADKTAATGAVDTTTAGPITHAQLVADHRKMEADHRIMQKADSVMEAYQPEAVANAKQAGIYDTPAFQELEKRHDDIVAQHQQIMARHDAVIKRHAALEAQHDNGNLSEAQLIKDHDEMKAEDQQIQQEHQQIVDDHARMIAQHKQLLAQAKK